jgi:hypothetical protein
MLPTTFQSHRTMQPLRLHAAHLVTEGPSPPPLSASIARQVVVLLAVNAKIHRTLNEIGRGVYLQQLVAAELQPQPVRTWRYPSAAPKARQVASQDRKYVLRML